MRDSKPLVIPLRETESGEVLSCVGVFYLKTWKTWKCQKTAFHKVNIITVYNFRNTSIWLEFNIIKNVNLKCYSKMCSNLIGLFFLGDSLWDQGRPYTCISTNLQFLGTPASSVSSKRIFSKAGKETDSVIVQWSKFSYEIKMKKGYLKWIMFLLCKFISRAGFRLSILRLKSILAWIKWFLNIHLFCLKR